VRLEKAADVRISEPMSDRAKYLARTLLPRMKELEDSYPDGDAFHDGENPLRFPLVAKVLATQEGITDEATIQAVLDAMPIVRGVDPRRGRLQNMPSF
jgi:hypothetical protein